MRSLKSTRSGASAKEIAGWTQASLLTVGSSLRSAGSTLVTGLKAGYDQLTLDHSNKERVTFVKFGRLEFSQNGAEASCAVLLLGYEVGFQLWSLRDTIKEIASRREGHIRCLEPLPLPGSKDRARCTFLRDWPLVALVSDRKEECLAAHNGCLPVSYVGLYSLHKHSYIHSIEVPGEVLSIACSQRLLLVAMSKQIMAYDLATLEKTYSAITYPAPGLGSRGPAVPLALGARWLAHASDRAVQSSSGIALAKPIATTSSRGSPAGNSMEAVQHYATVAAKTSGKHIKTIGEASYKYLTSQVENWRSSNGGSVPSSPSSTSALQPDHSDIVGTVIVRDMVTRTTLVHFRAHTAPLLLLRFDNSGTLLVTASVHGHTVNVFHIAPGRSGGEGVATHLFRLSRGVTPAVIQDAAFSCSGQWLCVSSARGTTHIFRLSLPGKNEALPPHLAAAAIHASDRKRFKPVKIQAAGRARTGGLLNGGIPGSAAAAAAVNLYNGTSGSCQLASTFLPQPADAEPSLQSFLGAPLVEDLYVVSNDGILLRNKLSVAASQQQHGSASTPEPTAGRSEGATSELAVEAMEQWDICRRLSWPERDEIQFDGNESLGEAGEVSEQLPWSAYAETCLPCGNSAPLWADNQFHILEMQTSSQSTQQDAGEVSKELPILQVEDVPTTRLNVQSRGGLAPVIIEGAETAVLRGAQLRASNNPHS